MGICVAWLLNVADPYRRDLVMVSLGGLAFIAWLSLTVLGVFGVNTALEKKEFQRRGQAAWLAELDQCSLSWCYGLAAMSLLLALVSLNILLWCVYPRNYIRQRTRNKDPIPLLRTVEGTEISDDRDKAEHLTQFFRSVMTSESDFSSSTCEDEETPTLEALFPTETIVQK
ncbi:hypothetical protein SprV_0902714000 [Sparganum proliferum]